MNAVGTKYLQSNGVLTTRYFDGTKVYAESIVTPNGTINCNDIPKQSDLDSISSTLGDHTQALSQLEDKINTDSSRIDTLTQTISSLGDKSFSADPYVYYVDYDEIPKSSNEEYFDVELKCRIYLYPRGYEEFVFAKSSLAINRKEAAAVKLIFDSILPTQSGSYLTLYIPRKIINRKTGNSWVVNSVSRLTTNALYSNGNINSFKIIIKGIDYIGDSVFQNLFDPTFGQTKVELAILSHPVHPSTKQYAYYNPVNFTAYVKNLYLIGSATNFNYNTGIVATNLFILPQPGSYCNLSNFAVDTRWKYATNIYLAPGSYFNVTYSGTIPTQFGGTPSTPTVFAAEIVGILEYYHLMLRGN